MPKIRTNPLVSGGPIVEHYLNDDDDLPVPKSKLNLPLSKAFTESSKSFKVVVVFLAAVALLAIATALVLALLIATGGDTDTPTPPPVTVTVAPTPFPVTPTTAAPTFFPTPATTASPTAATNDCPTTTLNTEIRAEGEYIALIFPTCPSLASFNAFTAAAKRWNDIIAANTLISFSVDFDVEISDFCGFPQSGYVFEAGYLFDHLVIFAETLDIDGAGGILGQAGPCIVDDQFLPLIGGMAFDNADLEGLETDGGILPVITHEMGHVLGIGSLFSQIGQGGGQVGPDDALAQDLVFDIFTGEVFPENRPKFVGTGAIAELETLSGLTEPFVPLEDGRDFEDNPFFDPTLGQGRGSIDSHWKFTRFIDELMVFQIDTSQPSHPLSTVSISSLQDMGYQVNLDKADAYALPLGKKNLRVDEPQGNGHIIDLTGDVMKTAKDVLSKKDIINAETKKKLKKLAPAL